MAATLNSEKVLKICFSKMVDEHSQTHMLCMNISQICILLYCRKGDGPELADSSLCESIVATLVDTRSGEQVIEWCRMSEL